MSTATDRKCIKCLFVKPLQAFYRQPGGKLGHSNTCKSCNNKIKEQWRIDNPEKYFEHRQNTYKRWREDPGKVAKHNAANRRRSSTYTKTHRRTHLRNKYGLTPEQYDAMYASQNGLCAICKTHHSTLCIDHNHDTGKVRELLCRSCNTAIGHLREDIGIMQSAIGYLEKHEPKTQQ